MTQTWLTQEAADRLRAELTQLEGPGRKEVTAKIEAARAEGDLKENGGYHAARDEQGKMEARIRQLKQMLETLTSELRLQVLTEKLAQAWLLPQLLLAMR